MSSLKSIFGDVFNSLNNKNDYSQEEQSDEIEYVLFAKLTDLSQLEKASEVEYHEQWEYRVKDDDGKPKGTMRVRKINEGDRYELTVKAYTDVKGKTKETTNEVTLDMYEAITMITDRMLKKIRYKFPVVLTEATDDEPAVTFAWEVDVFVLPDGSFYPWVKIDFEIPDFKYKLPSHPFKVDEVIDFSFNANPTEEQRATVDSIFESVKVVK